MTKINVGSLGFLLSLADYQNPGTTSDILTERTGAESAWLVSSGLFLPGPNQRMVNVELSDGDCSALVEDDPATSCFRYLHPEDGYIPLAPERLRTWRMDLAKLAKLLAQLLGMPASFQPITLVDGLLWDLGTPRLGTRKGIPVLFSVRLGEADVRGQLRRELDLRRGTPLALVLTSGQSIASDITLPSSSKIVPVLDVLDKKICASKTSFAVLDLARLAALADPRPAYADAGEAPVQCSADGSWLRIYKREFRFRGKKKQLIRLLYDAWAKRDEWVGEEWLLAKAEYDSSRIEDVFKDSRPEKQAAWKEYIETHDGHVRLKIPEQG